MRPLHQLDGFRVTDPRRFEVERGRKTKAAAFEQSDPDTRGNARAAYVELD
jgi:hypothetical protein